MDAADHDVQVSQQQRLVPIGLEQEGAHVGLEERPARRHVRLQLLQRQRGAPDAWGVRLREGGAVIKDVAQPNTWEKYSDQTFLWDIKKQYSKQLIERPVNYLAAPLR